MNRTKSQFTYQQLAADLSSIFLELEIRTQELDQRDKDCAEVEEALIIDTGKLASAVANHEVEQPPLFASDPDPDHQRELNIEAVRREIEAFFGEGCIRPNKIG